MENCPMPFGVMPDGTPVLQYTLTCDLLSCDIITYGGALRALRVPDRAGRTVDVALGFDTLEDYRNQPGQYIGALVGRYANRIGGAAFSLDGVRYTLAANDGQNHLHGGVMGFDRQVWTVEAAGEDFLTLSLLSPDGQEGYPGCLRVEVTYRLDGEGLTIAYRAVCDRDTVCNLTNHAYFNLSGHDSGPVTDQLIQIRAEHYTPTDAHSIPTGEVALVEGTPMDLRQPVRIGEGIGAAFDQLHWAGGYDHNWIPDSPAGQVRCCAAVQSPVSGITMEVWTDQPGIQFYSGNYLGDGPRGKDGTIYGRRCGLCLEAQCWPDSPNRESFPSPILRAGETYRQTTRYRFTNRVDEI